MKGRQGKERERKSVWEEGGEGVETETDRHKKGEEVDGWGHDGECWGGGGCSWLLLTHTRLSRPVLKERSWPWLSVA